MTGQIDRKLWSGRQFLVALSVAATVVAANWSIPFGRAQSSPKVRFEVAAIKQRTDGATGSACCLGAGGRLNIRNQRVSNLIGFAYSMKYYQLVGAPNWLESDRFDIEAAADGTRSQEEMKQMLQSLLEERFQLKVHRETRQLPVYTLTLAKGGSKLQAFREGDCVKYDPSKHTAPSTSSKPKDVCGFNILTQGRWNAS